MSVRAKCTQVFRSVPVKCHIIENPSEKVSKFVSSWAWARNLGFLQYFIDYFPIKLVKLAALDPSKNYIIGSHHHGLACFGAHSAFCTDFLKCKEVFPGITFKMMTMPLFHRMPLLRELMLGGGKSNVWQGQYHP